LTYGAEFGRPIERIIFTKGQSGPYTMLPGPNAGGERAILLGAGTWDVELHFTVKDDASPADSPADGTIVTTKSIIAASGYANYIYFYKRTNGSYDIGTGNTIPGDLDESNTKDTISDGMGVFEITNSSAAGSIIAQVKWMNVNYPVTIAQNNMVRLQVPAGTGNLSFRITTKTTFGIELAYTLRNQNTIAVNYMDSFENTSALPPPGSSSIVVDNQSTFTVDKLVVFKRNMDTVQILNTTFEPPGPIGPNRSASRIVENAGEVVIQVYMSASNESIVLSRAAVLSDTVVLIAITRTDTDDGTGKGTDDDETTINEAGGLRVFNNYRSGAAHAPDMKIFKFKLYQQHVIIISGTGTPQDPYVYGEPTYSSTPEYYWNSTGVTGTNTWNGENFVPSTYNPISRAGNDNIFNIPQGYYKVVIVATTYPWQSVVDHVQVPGVPGGLTEELISYNCGDIMIADKVERQYYFDVASGKEKDAPQGFVAIYIQYTGMLGGGGGNVDYHPAAFEEFVIPPKWDMPATWESANTGRTMAQATLYSNWPGAWDNPMDGIWAPIATRALLNTQILSYEFPNIGPFYLPPGRYFVRYGDTYGTKGRIFGQGSTLHWRPMDILNYGGGTVTVSLDPSLGVTFVRN
jgi:hypothetical protein